MIELTRDQILLEPIYVSDEKKRLNIEFSDLEIDHSQMKFGKVIKLGWFAGEKSVFPDRAPKLGDILMISMIESELITLKSKDYYLIYDYHFRGFIDDRDEFFKQII